VRRILYHSCAFLKIIFNFSLSEPLSSSLLLFGNILDWLPHY